MSEVHALSSSDFVMAILAFLLMGYLTTKFYTELSRCWLNVPDSASTGPAVRKEKVLKPKAELLKPV